MRHILSWLGFGVRPLVNGSDVSSLGAWQAIRPAAAADWLSSLTVPWWIAGGWALDLFLGSDSRPHGDLDIGILRRDAVTVQRHLSSWEIAEAKDGILTRLPAGTEPRAEVNSLWCRAQGSALWMFELLLDESIDDRWVFRRDPHIERPLDAIRRWSGAAVPYLAPEIQLLYKAKNPRERDADDFERVASFLEPEACRWLKQSLLRWAPQHEWLSRLSDH